MRFKDPNPITYREMHEHFAGMGLCAEFFTVSKINPDAPVTCNCEWDGGHEEKCDMVSAHEVMQARRKNNTV